MITTNRVAFAVLGAALCAGAVALLAPTTSNASAVPALTSQASATEAEALHVYEQITGSPAQRNAVDYLADHSLQVAQQACLRKAGFTYPMHAYVDNDTAYPLAVGDDSSWLAPLDGSYLTRRAEVEATVRQEAVTRSRYRSPYATDPSKNAAYKRALDACGSEGAESDSVQYPAGYGVVVAFHSMMTSVDNELARYSPAYQGCMARAGVAVQNYQQLVDKVSQRAALRPTESLRARAVADQEQRAAIGADAACRAPAHDQGYSLLRTRLTAFERANVATLAALNRYWTDEQTAADRTRRADPSSYR